MYTQTNTLHNSTVDNHTIKEITCRGLAPFPFPSPSELFLDRLCDVLSTHSVQSSVICSPLQYTPV